MIHMTIHDVNHKEFEKALPALEDVHTILSFKGRIGSLKLGGLELTVFEEEPSTLVKDNNANLVTF